VLQTIQFPDVSKINRATFLQTTNYKHTNQQRSFGKVLTFAYLMNHLQKIA